MQPLSRFGRVRAPWSQAQVPWSRSVLSHLPSGIRRVRLSAARAASSPSAFTSRLRNPLPGLRHCFRSLVPVSSGRVLWSARHPCLVSAESVPPGFKPRPLVIFTSAHAAPVSVLAIFRRFHCFPSVTFTLRFRARFQAYDTAFDRCAPVSSDRVLWSARHPCLVSGRVRAPWSSAQVPALLS